ncbi:MAG: adenylosuccinate synthase [Phycisphaerales bacterium]
MRPDNSDVFELCSPGHAQAVIGLQWGDEGKGKVIDLLAPRFQAVVRYNGGANAGHSVVFGGKRHSLHLIPSGVFHPGVLSIIGNGVVVDPGALIGEIEKLSVAGITTNRLKVSSRAHVVFPYHKSEDAIRERTLSERAADASIGTTKRGIGPAYADKATRSTAIRMADLLRPERLRELLSQIVPARSRELAAIDRDAEPCDADSMIERAIGWGRALGPYIEDSVRLVQDVFASNGRVLVEGANATLLDLDHGTFPFVTSSNCSALGICAGSGIAPRRLGGIIGVAKAYCTRVGGGPFPTEQANERGDYIRERGREYGTTTGRPRRCGWLDLVALRYAVRLNGVDAIVLTLLDVLAGLEELPLCVGYRIGGELTEHFPPDAYDLSRVEPVYERVRGFEGDLSGVRRFEDLPGDARRYVEFIETFAGAPVRMIGVGPDREQTIIRG